MQIINIDKEKFHNFKGDYRDFHTTYEFAEEKMKVWADYLNVGRNEKVYKFDTGHGIKWMVKQ